jgi:hypothetical protein
VSAKPSFINDNVAWILAIFDYDVLFVLTGALRCSCLLYNSIYYFLKTQKVPFYYWMEHHVPIIRHGYQFTIFFDWLQSYLKRNMKIRKKDKKLTLIILDTVLVRSLVLFGLLHLLSCSYWTWRSQFALVRWCTTRPSFSHCLLVSLFLWGNIWDLMWTPIELLMHAIHRIYPVILGLARRSWLLLTLCSISSIWPNMTTASRSIHNLHWSVSEGRKHRFRINIRLCLSFLHLMSLRSSMRHITKTVGVPYHHAVVVAQHVTVIYVRLVVLVVLRVSEHLSWSILHSLRRYGSFWTIVHFARAWSLVLICLKVRTTSRSWWMNIWAWHLVSSYHSSVDGPNVTMTLLCLLWSWPRSIICRVWTTCHFFNTTTRLILAGMISTLIIFAISSGLLGASTHVHILLLLYTALVTWDISWLWLILILFQ